LAHGRQVDGRDAVQTVEHQCTQFILDSLWDRQPMQEVCEV